MTRNFLLLSSVGEHARNGPFLAALLLCLLSSVIGLMVIVRPVPMVVCGLVEESCCLQLEAARLQYLGNQFASDGLVGHARNVWDLQAYEGKIYLGGGSTTENAGPIDFYIVWAYDPARETFDKEVYVGAISCSCPSSEQIPPRASIISCYLVFGGRATARDCPYIKSDGVWEQVSGGPDLAHVRDLYWHKGKGKLVGVGNSR